MKVVICDHQADMQHFTCGSVSSCDLQGQQSMAMTLNALTETRGTLSNSSLYLLQITETKTYLISSIVKIQVHYRGIHIDLFLCSYFCLVPTLGEH